MKTIFSIAVLFLTFSFAKGQSVSPYYRQFFYNPYLTNPAYVTQSKTAQAFVAYRQQWVGFRDAPVISSFSFVTPTSDRVSLGINLYTDKSVLLRNTNLQGTFGYTVPFDEKQSLNFGISAGIGHNKLDLSAEELNTNDPVITRAAGANWYMDGNVGILYKYDRLKLGFALVDIFKTNRFNTTTFNDVSFSRFSNRIYSIGYSFDLDKFKSWEMEPYAIYKESQDNLQDYWEVASIVRYKKDYWTGLSYNKNNGIGLFLGMNLKRFGFSYAYEFPPINSNLGVPASSHELMLSVKFPNVGHKPKPSKPRKPTIRPLPRDTVQHDTVRTRPTMYPIQTSMVKDSVSSERHVPAQLDSLKVKEEESVHSYYVTVAVFNNEDRARKFMKGVAERFEPSIIQNPENKKYYVYVYVTNDVNEAKLVRNQITLTTGYKDAWLFKLDR